MNLTLNVCVAGCVDEKSCFKAVWLRVCDAGPHVCFFLSYSAAADFFLSDSQRANTFGKS